MRPFSVRPQGAIVPMSHVQTASGRASAAADEIAGPDLTIVVPTFNERDNVAIVVNDFGLPAGSRFACGLTLRAFVPQGHKTALVDIAQDTPIIRYGEVIGYALAPILAGEWVDARDGIDLHRPSDAAAFAACPVADADLVDRAVAAAKQALASSGWGRLAPRERARALHRWADLIEAEAETLARLEAIASTRPISELMAGDVPVTAEQIRFFADMPEATQIDFLEATLDDVDQAAVQLDRMVEGWAKGDMAVLEREAIDELKRDYPAVYEVAVTRRNRAWADQLKAKLAGSGVSFVAVGGAHLVGPDSVLVELEKRGLKVTRY